MKGFYHLWAWRPSWSCDPDPPPTPTNTISFPNPTEAPYEIWLWAVLEKKIFKNGRRTTDGQRTTDDGLWLYYKLTNEPKGSGEIKIFLKSDFIQFIFGFMHVYTPWAVADAIGDKFWCQQIAHITFHFGYLSQVSKKKQALWSQIYNKFFIQPRGRGKQSLRVKMLMLSLCPFVANFKTISLKSDFKHIFLWFYISPRTGTDNQLGSKFWCQQKGLITLSICCKFQEHLLQLWFHTYFLMFFFYMYIASGQGKRTPGDKILTLTERPCHFAHFKTFLWTLILYTCLNVFPHVYSPGTGADNPLWSKVWCQQKSLITFAICCKFQKVSFNSDFIHIF